MAYALDQRTNRAIGTGLAGGAISIALLETLLEKNILTLDEARTVLRRALATATVHARSPAGAEAYRIITELARGWFSEHR
jgi:hypothetical protein